MLRCRAVAVVVLALATASPAVAQPDIATQKAETLRREWQRVFREVTQAYGLTEQDGRLVPRGSQVEEAYGVMLERLLSAPELRIFFTADPGIIAAVTRPSDREWVNRLAQSGAGAKGAKSLNGTATNPAAGKTAERSAFTDFVALALDARRVLSANDSAISINLNALALVGLKNPDVYSSPAIYRQHGALRRLGGTFTFGAKIPEAEVTGLTGLPSADRLLDVFVWDTKYRVFGDRDPRAARWYNEMLGTMGGLNEVAANLITLVPLGDASIVKGLLEDQIGLALARVKARVGKSTQVSVKAAGQHLTEETGKSKYAAGVLLDQGLGDTDLTVNVLYHLTNQVNAGAGGALIDLKKWSASLAVNSLVAEDVLVLGRATELSLTANVEVPVDYERLAVRPKKVWRVVAGVALPLGSAATIPVTITLVSDPNSLKKQKYVVGHAGINYDFGALKSLLK